MGAGVVQGGCACVCVGGHRSAKTKHRRALQHHALHISDGDYGFCFFQLCVRHTVHIHLFHFAQKEKTRWAFQILLGHHYELRTLEDS